MPEERESTMRTDESFETVHLITGMAVGLLSELKSCKNHLNVDRERRCRSLAVR